MQILDCRGLRCPMPIVEAGKALRKLGPGEEIQILATDPAFRADITAFCAHLGHELVSLSEDNGFTVIIKKQQKESA